MKINREIEHQKFMQNIDKQIRNLQKAPEEETYSRICHIAKQLIDYEKETGIKIF